MKLRNSALYCFTIRQMSTFVFLFVFLGPAGLKSDIGTVPLKTCIFEPFKEVCKNSL